MDACPKCGGKSGFYQKIVATYDRMTTWDLEEVECSGPAPIRGGAVKRCIDCRADVTKLLEEQL